MKTPVAMFVFNRPELTQRVFERIRAARPARLLVVCDGPRPDRPSDGENVAAVRRICESSIDWPCELIKEYSEANLGCMRRVSTGLNRAFELFAEAIILEDDCLPEPSFFPFCEEILERYRDDPRIMHIAGTNLTAFHRRVAASYSFSRHPWIWGWASWRRAWQHYDASFAGWAARQSELRASFASAWERQFWVSTMDRARQNLETTNTWDFQWNFSCRVHGGLSVVPRTNLVENLGFSGESSHTTRDLTRLHIPTQPLAFPLRHPRKVEVDRYADDLLTRTYANADVSFPGNLKARLRLFRERRRPTA